VQVFLLAELIGASHSAFENRIEAFDGVGVPVAALPFKLGVFDAAMLGKFLADARSLSISSQRSGCFVSDYQRTFSTDGS
jgi:hypothetical protein